MTTTIKVTNWQQMAHDASMAATKLERLKRNELSNLLFNMRKDNLSMLVSTKGLPSRIEIPISMDLVKELGYFAPCTHNLELNNNEIKFIWE